MFDLGEGWWMVLVVIDEGVLVFVIIVVFGFWFSSWGNDDIVNKIFFVMCK